MSNNMLEGRFWDLVDQNASYEEVERALMDMCAPHGVKVISCVEVRAPSKKSPPFVGRLIGKRDGEWLTRYRKEELFKNDVALQHVPVAAGGFSWQEVEKHIQTPEEQNVFDAAREHWVTDGYLMPVTGNDGRIGFTGFYGEEISDDPITRRLFEFAGYKFYQYAYLKSRSELAAEEPIVNLTERQLEVLYWVSKGRTDAEMAKIMNISPATVNRHVEMAKERIGVRSRTEAVYFALLHNLISSN